MVFQQRWFQVECEKCDRESYTDSDKCPKCENEGTIKPIIKDLYKCYLNGNFYGGGSLDYMRELFIDYVITCKMYGKKECEFKIIKD